VSSRTARATQRNPGSKKQKEKKKKLNVLPLLEYLKAIIMEILYLDSSFPNSNNVDASLSISRPSNNFLFTYDRLREEKMKEKQRHQEERLKAALERAVAQPKKKVCLLHSRSLLQSHTRPVLPERPRPF
jgi:hypothetical protein